MTRTSYRCPYCGHYSAITGENESSSRFEFHDGNRHGKQVVELFAITCENPDCREYSLSGSIHSESALPGGGRSVGRPRYSWQLIPPSNAKVMPDYVPGPIVKDYEEACAIQSLSPKASATLARRCLQGIIRDFWGISKPRLVDEIDALADLVDPLTWSAIDSVRKIGNIGAHMERDINVIVDVDANEAGLLIGLIETVVQDWYVVRFEREQRLRRVVEIAEAKLPPKPD